MPQGLEYQDSDGPIHAGVPLDTWMKQQQAQRTRGVDSTSADYDFMLPKWQRIQTVLDGTDAMRAATYAYLPKHEYESGVGYDERLRASVLDNWTSRTLEMLVGKAFHNPPQFIEPSPDVEELLKNADGSGTTGLAVARSWFREAVAKREAWLFVDYTLATPKPDGQPRTLADDANRRAYWHVVSPERVIFKQSETVDSVVRWSQIRVLETTMEPDGPFGEQLVERIRVHRPGTWELYRKVKDKKSKRVVWVFEDGGYTGLDVIPAVLFSVDEDKPPLEDLVHLNISHYQSSADQRSILTTSRFAMLAASGAQPQDEAAGEKPLVVGPKQWLSMPDPTGKFYYVEHSGQAILAGRTDMQDLEQRMASFGAEFMKRMPGRASATARALDSTEAQSLLQTWVKEFGEALERALDVTGLWTRKEPGTNGRVKFELEADIDAGDPAELQTLDAARARGDLSRMAYINELKRRHLLPDDFDPVADADQLKQELPPGTIVGAMFQDLQNKPDPKPVGKPGATSNPAKD